MNVRVVEKRRWPRLEINAPAKIIVMSGLRIKEMLACRVINISEGGALIATQNPIKVSEFYLEANNAGETLYQCAVVRRESMFRVGVRFLFDKDAQG